MILAHGENRSRRWTVTVSLLAVFVFASFLAILPSAGSVAIAAETIRIPTTPAVYGDVYGDLNKDGIYQWTKPEWGVRNVTVTLEYKGTSAAAGSPYVTIADVNGYYWFENLTQFGTYTLSIDLPEGFTATTSTSVDIEVAPNSVTKHQFGINGPQLFAFVSSVTKSVSASSAASADVSGPQ